ncbi:hypothetical protein TSUD_164520 [Trifolium subterraneum]|uniref:SET domain-containing protein n=1 Tax=Trifolium subterraneum TaxID=3900 RepID=A0A2Z6MAE7_TRISU|nr:hypothetical protein TSUD_164520 [Trifolium subterraneum]
MKGQVSIALSSSPSLVCKDISDGKEAINIIATNEFDDPPVAPTGAPVIEYIGVLDRDDKLDNSIENDYIFDIDCLHTINELDGRERRLGGVSLPTKEISEKMDKYIKNDPEFCIDAGSFGNVSRFINHGCTPNLFVQCVLSNHLDVKLARVMLFAAQDIPPYQELTYDYGYRLDSVVGPDGNIKQLQCHCGSEECLMRDRTVVLPDKFSVNRH